MGERIPPGARPSIYHAAGFPRGRLSLSRALRGGAAPRLRRKERWGNFGQTQFEAVIETGSREKAADF